MLGDWCWVISDSGHKKKSPYAGKSEIEYLRVCVRLEGLTSVSPSLLIRFKSVPRNLAKSEGKEKVKKRQN